ncbi:MAG: RagB/SusD family nutrient uptake outer membrane protein [Bacteroidota bacterium]
MKRTAFNSKILGILFLCCLSVSCDSSFLNIKPNGSLDASVLGTEEGIETLVIGVYSLLDGVSANGFGWESASSNWVFGSIRSLIANKGSDAGDQSDINPLISYTEVATNSFLNIKWRSLYDGVARSNSAINVVLNAEEDGNITSEIAESNINQLRLLRGHFHLEAYKLWGEKIPYLDENTDPITVGNPGGVEDQIIADLQAGTQLPNDMGQVGRFNGTVARVLLAKGLMQMKGDYTAANEQLQWVIDNGTKPDGSPIGLQEKYGDIFEVANRNGLESIYTVQYSVNDGSGGWNGGWGEVLNFPYKPSESPGGCCGFFQPNEEFVNSFRTSNGLPLLDKSYNNDPVLTDQGLIPSDDSYVEDVGPLDPRLDWTVGRRGIPYLDWGDHTGQDWIRDQSYAGPFSPKKQVYQKAEEGSATEVGNWTSGWTANGYRMIRYADVLLLKAECEVENGNLEAARSWVNQVRQRAANPDGFVKEEDGVTDAANYVIETYDEAWTDASLAMEAVMMERKLELGMEGHRFFDLKRRGSSYTENEINRILALQRDLRPSMYFSADYSSNDFHYPIPQRQIDLSNGNLTQNR